MLQEILIALIFIAAVFYLGRLIYKNFRSETACSSGCGKCSVVDSLKVKRQEGVLRRDLFAK
jgi:hypothetical protein